MNTPLPPNATELEQLLVAIDGERVLSIEVDIVRRAKDPATCPEVLLPWLAWEETVDVWEPGWPVERKRQAIAQSWALHRSKGTRKALEDAINLLGYGAVLEEWFETGRAAYTFRLRVDLGPEDAMALEQLQALTRTALGYKNVRSHLEAIVIRKPTPDCSVHVGGYIRLTSTIRNTYDLLTELSVRGRIRYGTATVIRQRIRLG